MAEIKHTKGPERKLVAVLGETKMGIYYPLIHPEAGFRSVYVSNTGTCRLSDLTIEALSRKAGHTPIHEGDTLTFTF